VIVSIGSAGVVAVHDVAPGADTRPAAHDRHDDWPAVGWKVFAMHIVCAIDPSTPTKNPGAAGAQAGEFGVLEKKPTGHAEHVLPSMNVPAGQLCGAIGVQAVAPVPDWVPAGHARHDVAEVLGWNVFAAHAVCDCAPAVATKKPGAAATHDVAFGPLEKKPGWHGVHVDPLTNVPAGQLCGGTGVHAVAPVADCVPAGHDRHDVAAVAG
jgi:hypothetical protein